METLHPFSHLPISDHRFVVQEMVSLHSSSSSSSWTKEENKMFERALAIYAEDSPDRWFKVASMIPGKTVLDVMKQYSKLEEDVFDIEAGRVPIPGYPAASSPLAFDPDTCRKRPNGARGSDQDRKKGVPWTEEEHRRFLLGLLKYCIHDITTGNLLNANLNRSFSDHTDILPDLGFIDKDNAEEGVIFMGQNLSSENLFSPSPTSFEAAINFAGQNAFSAGA
ncbi:unnamed protein product [Arabidopsis arenosa]|uniref:Uncharacterized protein n=1 Tax=Arabidopsis arenosa TaxID=38785 RepID=A0A8S1ZWZ1_ARAAE|nr:unnamed protein product [Arabidopsis arenosa]